MIRPSHGVPGAATVALAYISLLLLGACTSKRTRPENPPVPVTVVAAHRTNLPYTTTANGIVTPLQTATVAPQVDGIVTQVTFREGQEVAAGQILFRIEPSPYLAAYRQALAALARDSATAVNARHEVSRYDSLEAKDFVTHEQADQVRATASAADATVKADENAVAGARWSLDKTTIRAPISGRTGGLLIRTGNVVHAATGTPLVVINQIRPILVRFPVPGSDLPLIQRYGADKALPVTAVPGRSPAETASDTTLGGGGIATVNDPPPPQPLRAASVAQGALTFIDNAVDTTTGTVMLKASFANQAGTLWPGEFAAVSLRLFVEPDALVVPAEAVLTGQAGTYAYVVDSTKAAQQRRVTVERTANGLAVISAGLKDGERVVTAGQSRLTPGAKVASAR